MGKGNDAPAGLSTVEQAALALSIILIGFLRIGPFVLGRSKALSTTLGTAFPFLVTERFAARRWLFEPAPDGGYRLRALRTQRWFGWPEALRAETGGLGARLLGSCDRDSQGITKD